MNSTPIPMMETTNFTNYENSSNMTTAPPFYCDGGCIFYSLANAIIFILGVVGNGLVIWIAGFKIKKSINSTWYLSLALSDVLFCCTLPVGIVHVVKNDWIFGLFMCKFIFFNMYFNWFSSIFLLVIISVDRCVVVMFPAWAQNHRTTRKASVIVLLAWIISAVCSLPSAFYLDIEYYPEYMVTDCFPKYENYQQQADVVCRFVFGFMIPFLIIIFCYFIIIRKLKSNQMAKSLKPFKIMTVLIAAFLICWLPFHIVALLDLNYEKYGGFTEKALTVCVIFANANSCLNPFLYTFMGKDFKKQCYSVLTKIENAIREDESQYRQRGSTVTNSGETNLSTSV